MSWTRSLVTSGILTWAGTCSGQPLTVGSLGTPVGSFGTGVTVISFASPADRDGNVTSATFNWSSAPCPAAVKIKFFHLNVIHRIWNYKYLGERGPFDVLQTTQTVVLNPPFPVHLGDMIALASVSACGGPVQGGVGVSKLLSGDVTTDLVLNALGAPFSPALLAQAADDAVALVLLKNRFRVTLAATDPRTGRIAVGLGVSQGDRYGYFSLPDFTGDPVFPEVIVKMADATTSPPPFGGSFWFFSSSLTDVQYTLTVTDQVNGKTRTYRNSSSGAGQFCGGADTSAFPP